MSSRLTPEQKQEWRDRVESWRSSNKSAAKWCRENNVDYDKFIYWKGRFLPNNISKSTRTGFLEIPEEKTSGAGITIEYQGFHIHLSKQFDQSVLQALLSSMRRV